MMGFGSYQQSGAGEGEAVFKFTYLFWAPLGLRCRECFSLVLGGNCSLVAVLRPLAASLAEEHGL